MEQEYLVNKIEGIPYKVLNVDSEKVQLGEACFNFHNLGMNNLDSSVLMDAFMICVISRILSSCRDSWTIDKIDGIPSKNIKLVFPYHKICNFFCRMRKIRFWG